VAARLTNVKSVLGLQFLLHLLEKPGTLQIWTAAKPVKTISVTMQVYSSANLFILFRAGAQRRGSIMQIVCRSDRRFLQCTLAFICLFFFNPAFAHHIDTHFEDSSAHKIVYQCNKADAAYLSHILFSVGELIRKYGDDVEIVVACFGPGIHLLAQSPGRPIPVELQQRASSLAAYGVVFHACKNTMDSLNWSDKNLVDYAKVVPIGVEDIMLLQEQGFSYFSW